MRKTLLCLALVAAVTGCGARSAHEAGAAPALDATGLYDFTVQVMGNALPVQIRIQGEPERYVGHVSSRAVGEERQARSVQVRGQQVTVVADSPAGDIVFRFNVTGDAFRGTWSLGGQSGPMTGQRRALPGR